MLTLPSPVASAFPGQIHRVLQLSPLAHMSGAHTITIAGEQASSAGFFLPPFSFSFFSGSTNRSGTEAGASSRRAAVRWARWSRDPGGAAGRASSPTSCDPEKAAGRELPGEALPQGSDGAPEASGEPRTQGGGRPSELPGKLRPRGRSSGPR
jgi:hypothetical protein